MGHTLCQLLRKQNTTKRLFQLADHFLHHLLPETYPESLPTQNFQHILPTLIFVVWCLVYMAYYTMNSSAEKDTL